jgi:hypothetical protein
MATNGNGAKRKSIAGFKEGLERTEHFGNPPYQNSRPDLVKDFDAMFEQVAEVPMKNGEDNEDTPDQPRGYIPTYDGRTRKDADHGPQPFFETMQQRRPK